MIAMATRAAQLSIPLFCFLKHHQWFFFSADEMRSQETGQKCVARRFLLPADGQNLCISTFKSTPQPATEPVTRWLVVSRQPDHYTSSI
jgi:hypothetical protein